jgi:excisionase family DNA binding protein
MGAFFMFFKFILETLPCGDIDICRGFWKMDELMTVKEVSQILRIGTSTIYQMARERKISHVKIGDRLLFHKPDIENLVLKNTITAK